MAVTATPVFVQTPKRGMVQILPADTTTLKTLVTAGSNGSKVSAVTATSNDTSNRVLQLYVTRSATDYLLGSATATTLAGTDGATVNTNLFALSNIVGLPLDNDGQPYIFLESGDVLKVASTVTITSAKAVNVSAVYGDF